MCCVLCVVCCVLCAVCCVLCAVCCVLSVMCARCCFRAAYEYTSVTLLLPLLLPQVLVDHVNRIGRSPDFRSTHPDPASNHRHLRYSFTRLSIEHLHHQFLHRLENAQPEQPP